jgi:hypothetical protein
MLFLHMVCLTVATAEGFEMQNEDWITTPPPNPEAKTSFHKEEQKIQLFQPMEAWHTQRASEARVTEITNKKPASSGRDSEGVTTRTSTVDSQARAYTSCSNLSAAKSQGKKQVDSSYFKHVKSVVVANMC